MFRVLVTGSRNWEDESAIHQALRAFALACGSKNVTVVHGGANGADRLAHLNARHLGMAAEPHPAEWAKYGKRAGFVRNKAMVEAGVRCMPRVHPRRIQRRNDVRRPRRA